ncbi:MAG: CapA family protein [Clostridia bacterium]|nr:CapA family protein [Clostridia bacterium]
MNLESIPASRLAGSIVLALFSAALILYHAALPDDLSAAAPETDASLPLYTETLPSNAENPLPPESSDSGSDTGETEPTAPIPDPVNPADLADAAAQIPADPAVPLGALTEDFFSSLPENAQIALDTYFHENPAPDARSFRYAFYAAVGYTPLAYAHLTASGTNPVPASPADPNHIASLVFTGDFNLGEDFSWCPIRHLGENPSVSDFLLPPLDSLLASADLICINLECVISDRGTPTPNKAYTFRGSPENVRLLTEAGCDIVSLANNHVYDYGPDALLDTMQHLTDAQIAYVGAGADLAEASSYKALVAGGLKIGFAAASNAEKFYMTPIAEENAPGILTMYDPALMLETVSKAAADCDFVVYVVHWGTENSTVVNDNQIDLAGQFAEAGADAVIGHHPHVLQKTDMIGDVPVAYSLGNFWFNTSPNDTAAAELVLSWNDDAIDAQIILHDCRHENGVTTLVE